MLLVAPSRKTAVCLVVNNLKHKHEFCFPLTAWNDHTDYFSQPQSHTAANTRILMKPIKNHRLGLHWHNYGKTFFRPSMYSTAAYAGMATVVLITKFTETKAVFVSVWCAVECLQTYFAFLPYLSPWLRCTFCSWETHVDSLSGNLSLHPFLSVLENDMKSISQGLDASDVIL